MNTPKTFEPVVTDGMDDAIGIAQKEWLAQLAESCDGAPEPEDLTPMMIKAALAHPDFQRQLRAYAAEVARAMVPGECSNYPWHTGTEWREAEAHNACRAATLSAIDEWEKNV